MPNSHSNSFNGSYPAKIEDQTRLKELDDEDQLQAKQKQNGVDKDKDTHILMGNTDFSLPNAHVQGTAPPLTARPYQLSKGYSHLVESPDRYREVIIEKLGKLQTTLSQLGSDDLRQAKADIIYLKSILDDEGADIAQIKAGANWASRE
ncbi:hypothetical protein L486_00521 [Kwoniella mangroviensis CBS 10435]|uniref:Uncharacterized protein n=2 Tax=Kwoniella mangrovensis TaxID=463800 RepID=A0A1B9IZC3_9TREE|nr:uncharacterized protein I203_04055 [Kwoniella mangroviensis CBS 8507]OCF60877.1 hypothetical protein L486_00521 [Kwoniella mangroviensis CBS 10435]OCF66479.1 hypothetical protein I203_04055 [Kwoniella mangroviensis CBS 8507]OCF74373.1 hypothetical protein I204_04744 [Kwoniella mangroviensis CBS 8886]